MVQFLTTAEVAAKAGRSLRTVSRWIHDENHPLTPCQKLPGRAGSYLFHPDHVAEVLNPEGRRMRFAIDDKVRIVANHTGRDQSLVGTTGRIAHRYLPGYAVTPDRTRYFEYLLEIPLASGRHVQALESELECACRHGDNCPDRAA